MYKDYKFLTRTNLWRRFVGRIYVHRVVPNKVDPFAITRPGGPAVSVLFNCFGTEDGCDAGRRDYSAVSVSCVSDLTENF